MKKIVLIVIGLMLTALVAAAQQKDSRDLYVDYGKNSASGKPGAKISIELERNGRRQFVSPKTEFRSGDKVAFHFELNFPAYVAIIQQGSSGKKSLLFPYEGASNKASANKSFRMPQGGNWFAFDATPGEEKLLFVMSTSPLPGINQPVPTPSGGSATVNPGPGGGPASGAEEQQILDELNSRAHSGGRDLVLDVKQNDGYLLSSPQKLKEPVGFLLTLIHR